MKIELKQLTQEGKSGERGTQVVMLEVTGEVDMNNYIVKLAREMIQSKGSAMGLASFDAAVTDGLLRLSVGLEDVHDLWDDLSGALDRVQFQRSGRAFQRRVFDDLRRNRPICRQAAHQIGNAAHGGQRHPRRR